MTQSQIKLLLAIANAITEAVKAAGPTGAPGGVIYAALMAQGCTLAQYEQLMAGMVQAGKLTRHGDCYRLAEAAR